MRGSSLAYLLACLLYAMRAGVLLNTQYSGIRIGLGGRVPLSRDALLLPLGAEQWEVTGEA
jgi:hypothetical protein